MPLVHCVLANVLLVIFSYESLGVVWVTPLNAVGLRGKSVIFECSITDLKDHLQWNYRSRNGRVVTIWEKPGIKHKQLFEKVDVFQNTHPGGHFGYDLTISDLALQDEGIYVCVVVSGRSRSEHPAILSILDVDSCYVSLNPSILSHECNLLMAGPAKYRIRWNCQQYAVYDYVNKSDAITNYLGETVPLQVSRTMAKMSISTRYPVTLITCFLEVSSINNDGQDVSYKDYDSPYFHGNVFLLSELPYLESELVETCLIESSGLLRVSDVISFDETYSKRHKLVEPVITVRRHVCMLPMTTAPLPTISLHEGRMLINCEDLNGLDCLQGYTRLVVMGTYLPRISSEVQRRLCALMDEVEACVTKIEPCAMSKKMKGMLESYRFLCQSRYVLANDSLMFSVDIERCFDHYPQTIANLLLNESLNSQLNAKRLRNITTVNFVFCQHLAGQAEMNCMEHSLASYRSLTISRWYARFINILNQIELFRLMAFTEVQITDYECYKNSDPLQYQQCPFAENCAMVYAVLLRSIHFGMVFIDNFTLFDTKVCQADVDLEFCQRYLVENCDFPTMNLYMALIFLRRAMCGNFRKKLMEYQGCYMSIYTSPRLPERCHWSQEFMTHYIKQDKSFAASLEGCRMAMEQISCVHGLVARECGAKAGKLQKVLLRILFSGTILRSRCFFLSSFANAKNSRHYMMRGSATLLKPSWVVGAVSSVAFILSYYNWNS